MAGALGASAAFRPGTRAAHVFLERNPYVAWEAQRPAFAQPAFTGVVHPHLPHWESPADDGTPRDDATDAADAHHPPEPTSASRSWLPRVARLGPMEARALPSTHVQTVSASWCRDLDDARAFMRVAADAGATALLCVTGDASRHAHDLDALALLRAARALRDAGEIDSDVRLACAANPCAEASTAGASDGSQKRKKKSASARLEEKLEAGAETVITQPSVVPALARVWRQEIHASGLVNDVEHIAGIAIPTSKRAAERWMRLVFGASYDDVYDGLNAHARASVPETKPTDETVLTLRREDILEQLDAWDSMQRFASHELSPDETTETFMKRWIEERAELAAAEALTCVFFPANGAHVMPVTPLGYASATAVADAIQRLTQ